MDCNCDNCSDAKAVKKTPCPEFCEFYPPKLVRDEEREKSFYDADGKRKPCEPFTIERLMEINERLKKVQDCDKCCCEFPREDLKKIDNPYIDGRFLFVCIGCDDDPDGSWYEESDEEQ
jgi:hypothetical protein